MTASTSAIPMPDIAPQADPRLEELAQIIRAYTQVTDKLEKSHAMLGSEVERLQKELASTDAQLQRSRRLAALGEMAAGIAHEIRNPLGAIQLYAGMLEEDMTTLSQQATGHPQQSVAIIQEAAQTARKIASAVRGLDSIVNDVLTFSREMQPRAVSLGVPAVLGRCAEAIWPVVTQANIRLILPDADTRPELDHLMLLADPELLHQAMLNLMRNAVDAITSHKAGDLASRTIWLDARREGTHVVLIVRDSGPGIPEQAIDRIFNPFFTTRDTGTGLGLAIVHRIADAHGGAIAAFNDQGAVFELSLPAVVGQDASMHLPAMNSNFTIDNRSDTTEVCS